MKPVLILKHISSTLTKPVLCCLIFMQLGAGFVISSESVVTNHLFPESLMRDVAFYCWHAQPSSLVTWGLQEKLRTGIMQLAVFFSILTYRTQ